MTSTSLVVVISTCEEAVSAAHASRFSLPIWGTKKAINGFHVHEIGTTHHAFAYGRFRNSCVRHMMQRKALASWKQSLIS